MKNLLLVNPNTNVNESLTHSNLLDFSILKEDVKDPIIQGYPNDENFRFSANFYNMIACDLVVETVLNYPYPYITEKTLRPIACKRMFIIVGAQNTLSLLKGKGFKTFSDIVDERYDTIECPITRLKSAVYEMEKICNIPLDELKNIMQLHQNIFEHNFNVLKNLQNRELEEFKIKLKI